MIETGKGFEGLNVEEIVELLALRNEKKAMRYVSIMLCLPFDIDNLSYFCKIFRFMKEGRKSMLKMCN